MASPQKENGFVPIANEIMESLAKIKFPLSHYEWKILIFLFRKTYGWGKPDDEISLSQFCEGTKILKPHVCRALQKLIQKNIITQTGNTITQTGNGGVEKYLSYKYQKDYENWTDTRLPKQVTVEPLPKQVTTITRIGKGPCVEPLPEQVPTKDNNKDTILKTGKKSKKFTPPTVAEIAEFCRARKNNIDPEYFYHKNNTIGWKDKNGNPYKSWKSVIITWEKWNAKNEPIRNML